MIVIGSLQDSFLKLIILARFWRTRDGLAEPTAASNYIFESVQQPLQAYRLERPRPMRGQVSKLARTQYCNN